MGYYSSVYVRGGATISAKVPEFSAQELADRELFEAEAKARGYEFSFKSIPKVLKLVQDYLKNNESDLGYFFGVEATDDSSVVELIADGESGKAYELEEDLRKFVEFLSDNDLLLNARVYRSGEDNGDLERWVITDNEISHAEAELRFPDGEVA